MGLRIDTVDETAPLPRQTRLTLVCDNNHGLFPVAATFEHHDGFIMQYRTAMESGWKENSRGVRYFSCPHCSGK